MAALAKVQSPSGKLFSFQNRTVTKQSYSQPCGFGRFITTWVMPHTFQAAWFLTANGQSLSLASALQHNTTVSLSVYPSALQHFSPLNACFLFGCTIQKSAFSSRLKMSFRAYWAMTVSHMLSAPLCQINVCCGTFFAH